MTDESTDMRHQQETAPELRPGASNRLRTAVGDHTSVRDPETRRQFADLSRDEIDRIPVLAPGARLEQGSTYLDLEDMEAGPFVAIGNEEVVEGDRLIAKRDTDYEMWSRLTGDREARVLRPR